VRRAKLARKVRDAANAAAERSLVTACDRLRRLGRIAVRRGPDPSERLKYVLALPDDPSSRAPLLLAVEDASLDVARAALRKLVPLAGSEERRKLRRLMFDVDIGLVADIASALRALGDRQATAAALTGLSDESGFRRHKAAVALRELADPEVREALLSALADDEAAVRRVAAEALGRIPTEPLTVSLLKQQLEDVDASARAAAVSALAGLAPDPSDILALAIVDRHERVRQEAARVSAKLDPALVRRLLDDPAANVRREALQTLRRHPRHDLVPAVAETLGDPNWHVREAACRALGAAGITEPLFPLLVDPHTSVRRAALAAFEDVHGASLEGSFTQRLRQHDQSLQRELLELLAERGTGSARPLAALIASPDASVRLALAHALTTCRDSEAVNALRYLAGDENADVRHAALTGLDARKRKLEP
jgi:HEAT repeat protein